MNKIIETLKNHRSIRKFTNEPLTDHQIKEIIESAQCASTSSNVMAYTIIGVTDSTLKQNLYEISGHKHVKTSAHLLLFCADLHRIHQLEENPDENPDYLNNLESTEQFMVSVIDATLASQNAAIAAESMGLGICYLGSLRNNIRKFNDLLQLPQHVIPLFGLAIGHPDHQPDIKPRLPMEAIYHENTYKPFEDQKNYIQKYDETITNYYASRSSNNRIDTWSNQMKRKFAVPTRMDVSSFVKEKHMNRK